MLNAIICVVLGFASEIVLPIANTVHLKYKNNLWIFQRFQIVKPVYILKPHWLAYIKDYP